MGNVTGMGDMRNTYKILVGQSKEKNHLGELGVYRRIN
jgi:hypothetical protein